MTKAKATAAQKKDNEKGRKSLGVHLPDKNEHLSAPSFRYLFFFPR